MEDAGPVEAANPPSTQNGNDGSGNAAPDGQETAAVSTGDHSNGSGNGNRNSNSDDHDLIDNVNKSKDAAKTNYGSIESGVIGSDARHSVQTERMNQEELRFRKDTNREGIVNVLVTFVVNGYSAVLVFVFYLISIESLFSIALSVALTTTTYYRTKDDDSINGGLMNWILLSFSVITPMSSSISMAFGRREQALSDIAAFKSTLRNLYMAHACWDWAKATKPDSIGRHVCETDWLQHSDDALHIIRHICEDATRHLTLPSTSRARHRVTSRGKKEAEAGRKLAFHLHRSTLKQLVQLSQLCEELKRQGLPPNEATRIRQWERMVNEQLESLRFIKEYRTPQALRSFARLFSVFLPPFYAPYYAELAQQLNSLGMAIAFSVLTSIALTSLFESLTQMEDPFVGLIGLDGIDLEEELLGKAQAELLDVRKELYPNALPFVTEDGRLLSETDRMSAFPAYRIFAEG